MWSRDIISGKQKGAAASLSRLLFSFLSVVYSLIIRCRNCCYDLGIFSSQKISIPVISIGNITVGGTGKTPMVIWVSRQLQRMGKKVALVSRGYKSQETGENDEMVILKNALPNIILISNSNRVEGGNEAIKQGADIVVLDDGMQHRRISRDLNIVMLDATCPFGYDWILPRGLLREPLRGLKRSDAIVLSRSDLVSENDKQSIYDKIKSHISDSSLVVAESQHQPVGLIDQQGEILGLDAINGKNILAFCGIGHPDGFIETLKKYGANVIESRYFADHYHYRTLDVEQVNQLSRDHQVDFIVTTEKDWVKIEQLSGVARDKILWLKIELDISSGQEQLLEQINHLWPNSMTP